MSTCLRCMYITVCSDIVYHYLFTIYQCFCWWLCHSPGLDSSFMSQARCVGLDLLVQSTASTADASISKIIPHSHEKGFHKISWLGGIEITTMRNNLHATMDKTTQPRKDRPPMYTFSWSLVTLKTYSDSWVRPIAGRQESTKTLFMVELNFFTSGG